MAVPAASAASVAAPVVCAAATAPLLQLLVQALLALPPVVHPAPRAKLSRAKPLGHRRPGARHIAGGRVLEDARAVIVAA